MSGLGRRKPGSGWHLIEDMVARKRLYPCVATGNSAKRKTRLGQLALAGAYMHMYEHIQSSGRTELQQCLLVSSKRPSKCHMLQQGGCCICKQQQLQAPTRRVPRACTRQGGRAEHSRGG